MQKGSVSIIHIHSKECKKENHVDFCIVMCISHMHSTLTKAIGYVTAVIQMLC